MHDIKAIIADPEAFDAGLARRGLPPMAQELIAKYNLLAEAKRDLQETQTRINKNQEELNKIYREQKKPDVL